MVQESERLRDILQEKITQKIEEAQRRSRPILDKIEKDGTMLEDFVAPLGERGKVSFGLSQEYGQGVRIRIGGSGEGFRLHPHASEQAGGKLGIPGAYIRNLVEGQQPWQRELAARTLDDHARNATRQRILVRTIGDEARGILSDHYRRLNTSSIYGAFITKVKQAGGMVLDAFADDLRSWIEAIIPQILEVPTAMNSTVYMTFGARISSSDFGNGALEVRAFFLESWCLNAHVRENVLRQVHLGSRLPDEMELSRKTYELDTRTMASAVHDITGQLFLPDGIKKGAETVQKAGNTPIDIIEEVKRLPKVGVLKGEVDEVVKVFTNGRPSDGVAGGNSLWKLSQAVSAVARVAQPRRKRELEEISGSLLESVNGK